MKKKRRPPRIDASTAPGHPAYKMGLTGGSYTAYKLGAVPLALAERSPGGIRREAQRLTKAAYGPVQRQLNEQENRARSIADKREADNNAFAQWVSTQSDAIRAQAIGQASEVGARIAQGQQEFATQLQGIRDSAAAKGVTGGADAAQLEGQFAGARAATQATANAAQAHIGAGMDTTLATLANNPAVVAASRAKDFADSLQLLGGVADSRQKVVIAQAQDHARNLQNLLQQEITKAQAVIAGQQFSDKLSQTATQKAADRKTSIKKTRITAGGTAKNAAGQPSPVPSYTRGEWNKHAASWRQRKLKEYQDQLDKGGKGDKGRRAAIKKATAKANNQLNSAIAYAKGEATPPAPSSGTIPAKPGWRPGKVKPIIDWIVSLGFEPAVARMAALKLVYPKLKVSKKTAPATAKAWQTYIDSLTGSR